tara:strand:- start:1354 stop:2235 length:882 start_codon:yes stop_codon:yes gene_type:complete
VGNFLKIKAYVYAIIYFLLIPVFALVYSFVDLDLGNHNEEGVISYLYFSVVSITTLGYGDILPSSSAAQITAALEALLGLILIGLFLNALSMQHSREVEKVEQEKKNKENLEQAISRLHDLTFYRGEDQSFRLFGALKYVLSLGAEDVSIPEGKLSKLKIKSLKLLNSNLVAVDFSNSKLNDVKLTNCNLEAAQFVDSEIKECYFIDVNFKRSRFINSQLKGMNFNSCDIKNVTFKNCELQSAIFSGVDCEGVSFKGCNLRSANFKNAKNITEKKLKEAKDYRYIKLPDDMNL